MSEMSIESIVNGEHRGEARDNAHWFYTDLVVAHVRGAETGGRFCVVEFLQPPGKWTPLHVHRTADQIMYVLEGEITVHLPDGPHTAGSGEHTFGPRNVPHTEQVSDQGARVVEIVSPAGFDEFIAAAGEPATELTLPPADRPEPDLERLTAIAAEHGIEILGPPGALP